MTRLSEPTPTHEPIALRGILEESARHGFTMASDARSGSLLRALAASKPGGQLLELGTGTGVGTSWLLDGMDSESRLVSIDSDGEVSELARRHLGSDPRVTFLVEDGGEFLRRADDRRFDLIFADAWPGKFWDLELALSLVRRGGIYFIDDLLPRPNWPEGHAAKVGSLVAQLENHPDFVSVELDWSSGLMMLVRSGAGPAEMS